MTRAVMLVEDNPADVDLFLELKPNDWQVDVCGGLEAAAQATGVYDVAFLDLGLPESSGLDTLSIFRSHCPRQAVIVMTGLADEQLGRAAIRAGALDFIPKAEATTSLLQRVAEHAVERERLIEELHQSEARWRALLRSAPNIIMELALDGTIDFLNRDVPPVTRERAIGRRWSELARFEKMDTLAQAIQRVIETGTHASLDVTLQGTTGEPLHYSTQLAPVLSKRGEVKSLVVTALDETERYREHERLTKILEASPNGMLLVSDVGEVLFTNRATTTLFGYSKDELVGLRAEQLISGADKLIRDACAESLSRTDRQRLMAQAHQLTGTKKDGGLLELQVGMAPLQLRERPVSLWSVVDLTEKEYLEEQLRQAQRMEAIGRIAGGVAHDFNNLLTVILSFGRFVRDDLQEGSTARDDMDELLRAAERAQALTGQLLAFSRRKAVAPQVLCINAQLGQMRRMLARVLGEDIQLHMPDGREEELSVRIDPGAFEQVVMNLAVNARDAMPQGGSLIVKTRSVSFSDTSLLRQGVLEDEVRPGAYVILSVRDTGVGMEQRTCEQAFEPFFTTKPKGQGTGLGLSTCYGIVRQAGGLIRVSSVLGRGTTFSIYLPRVEPAPAAAESPVAPPRASRGETILVVEDDDQLRRVVARTLESAGYNVLCARSGAEALRFAADRDQTIDLLLTDVVMPQMSGKQLHDQLELVHPGLITLYMSGYGANVIANHGILDEGVMLVQKPFDSAVLTSAVSAALHGAIAGPRSST